MTQTILVSCWNMLVKYLVMIVWLFAGIFKRAGLPLGNVLKGDKLPIGDNKKDFRMLRG